MLPAYVKNVLINVPIQTGTLWAKSSNLKLCLSSLEGLAQLMGLLESEQPDYLVKAKILLKLHEEAIKLLQTTTVDEIVKDYWNCKDKFELRSKDQQLYAVLHCILLILTSKAFTLKESASTVMDNMELLLVLCRYDEKYCKLYELLPIFIENILVCPEVPLDCCNWTVPAILLLDVFSQNIFVNKK